jgi:hypothetical protein
MEVGAHVPHRLAGHRVDRLSLNYHLRAPSLRAGDVVVLGQSQVEGEIIAVLIDGRYKVRWLTGSTYQDRVNNRHCRGGSQEELAESSVASILPCFLRNTR